ncbi:FecR domain-containing protein [Armatimonas sp.]|uniref:FecR domain-containing protein n=1 Tax=Armatimonas sp. TaxID=1872638 RepID=UPI00375184DB
MNDNLPETSLSKRLLEDAAQITPAPSGLWERVENKRSKKPFPTRIFGLALVTGALVLGLTLLLRPKAKTVLSDWRLDNRAVAIGETLEAARSALTLAAPGIGTLQLAPGSRARILESRPGRQRVGLESGSLRAKVTAPPRLFVVETPSATATDLGCEYSLTIVNEERGLGIFRHRSGSILTVTSGYVEMVDQKKRTVLVPAGASVQVMPDGHQGLPWYGDNPQPVADYDATGKLAPLLAALKEPADTLTLFHLLPRVTGAERSAVLDKLLTFTTLPGSVTREQVLALDSKALATWREELKLLWGGAAQLGI